MSSKPFIYDDCCLLTNIDLNSQRIYRLLERRFKSNSNKTSFDFKSFSPEHPSNNTKVSRSLLRFQPKIKYTNDCDDNISSDSSSSEEEDDEEILSTNDDDYLNKLAEWEPENFQPTIDTDDDDEEDENIIQSVSTENNDENHQTSPMEQSPAKDTSTNSIEDLLVTFIHRPLKTEPISDDDNPPQLDGQIDLSTNSSSKSNQTDTEKKLHKTIAKITANKPQPPRTIQLHKIPPIKTKFRLIDDTKKQPTNQSPKRSSSIPVKIDRPKEQPKPRKKVKPYLLQNLIKTNEETIRPLHTPIPTTPTKFFQKTFRTSTDSRLQKNMLSNHGQQSSSILHKQKNLSQNSKSKEKSALHYMTLAENKLNYFQKHQFSTTSSISTPSPSIKSKKPKLTNSVTQKLSKTPLVNDKKKKIKKIKRLDTEKSNNHPRIKDNSSSKFSKQKSIENLSNSSVVKNPQLTSYQSEPTNSNSKINQRPADFFKDCIEIDDDDDEDNNKNDVDDDDDIQEIERQPYSLAYNIRAREKLLDHAVHSPIMHIKWLSNLEYVLLQHILIYHENNIRSLTDKSVIIQNEFSSYKIDPSFISIIIINFLKIFILRYSLNEQQEVSFIQFGLTSHLHYLLIDIPTYKHNEEKDLNDNCSKCHQYSLIINILFDLLFDLIEYDLCERISEKTYRSSLIEDDYFTRFLQSNNKINTFDRIKLMIYFIELIGIHMNKCSNKKQFQFNKNENKLFHSIEDFIRHIISHITDSVNQRLSICFNVMELCILFVNEKEIRMKQMALFLYELCENNTNYLNLFLFSKNLISDIRLVLINELISKNFSIKLISIDHIKQFFCQIEESFNSTNRLNEFEVLILRSLFNTYADLIIEIKVLPLMYSNFVQELTLLLRNQLDIVFRKLFAISDKTPEYFQETKKTLMLFRLLKCKWNKL